MLLENDATVRVHSRRVLVSSTLCAAKLVASDGRMNAPNERGSIESDEVTFIERQGRSLHLVGQTCRNEPEQPTTRVGQRRQDS